MRCHWNSRINNVTRNANIDIDIYLHSLKTYTTIFRGNSPYSTGIFRLQKKIRTISNSKNRDSCRNLFKNFNILTFISVVITNREQYITNSNIHCRKSRQGFDIDQTVSKLSVYQRDSYQMGLKVFNILPTYVLYSISCVTSHNHWSSF